MTWSLGPAGAKDNEPLTPEGWVISISNASGGSLTPER